MAVTAMLASCTTPSIDERVDALYERMTPEERLAQLHGVYIAPFFDENGVLDTALCRAQLSNGAGHFSQYAVTHRKSPEQMRDMVAKMQDWLIHNTPSGVPALFHEEVLSGVAAYDATVYPQQIGLACSFNPCLAEQKTRETAASLRKIGGALALSPMVDVVRNPSFNRLEESYGEDGYLSAVMGVAFVRGLQGDDLKKGIAACTKHFLGYGGGGDAPLKERMEEILLPHEAIIRTAGSQVVMTGYHAVDGVKCVANADLQQQLLREYLHFDGLLVSDYGSIEQIPSDNLPADTSGLPIELLQAVAAFRAGNDVDFPEGKRYSYLPQAIEAGLVSEQTFEQAVKRVLRLKAQLGLLDSHPILYADGPVQLDTEEERQTAYTLATQSVVLLENKGVLPIKNTNAAPARIALVGPNANSMWAMLGDYTYHSMRYFWQRQIEDAMHPRIITLREGLTDRLPEGFTLDYARGCDWTEEVETIIEDGGDERAAYMKSIQNRKIDSGEPADADAAIRMAAESDVIVAAMGENVILCGENRDRTSLRLPGQQEAFVERLIATGKPVVLIVFGGRAQVISSIADRCAAVIQAWYPGEEGGHALADILFGNVCPSGKLSVSYPAVELHEPICYNSLPTIEGRVDTRIAYPFGYGLSYTTFAYANMHADTEVSVSAEDICVSVDVTNTGAVAGEEIVQLYLSPLDRSACLKPIQLQGFSRVSLSPGETKTVSFRLSPEQFGYWVPGEGDAVITGGHWQVNPGRYMVKIGASSADIRTEQEVCLTGDPRIQPLRTRYFAQ